MQDIFGLLMDSNILFTKAQISENFNMTKKILNLGALSERLAATRIGQFVITKTERALWVVEKTAAWGLPHKHRKDSHAPERPLPWIPFFMLIILLRVSRASLTLMAILLNKSGVTPEKTVLFIQSKRRELRAIKRRGLVEITAAEQEPSPARESATNSVSPNNVQKKRISCHRTMNSDLSWGEMLNKHVDEGSDTDDSDYVFGMEETSTESDEISENEDVPENVENLQNDVEQNHHPKSEAKDNEETISETEDAHKENNDPPSPNHQEHNHVSSLQVKLSHNKPKESPIHGETLMPNSAIDPEVLVEKLTNELQKMENAQNAYNTSYDGDSSMDPSLLAHNGGNLEDLNKHVNEIFKAKDVNKVCANQNGYVKSSCLTSSTEDIYYSALASPNVENTLENHHPLEKVETRESQTLIREEKAASRAGATNRTQNVNKSDKNTRSSSANLKRSKAPVPRRTK